MSCKNQYLICSNKMKSEMFTAATTARLRHWQLLVVIDSSFVQFPEGLLSVSRLKRDQEPYPRFGGEQERPGGRGLVLLLREEDQTLNTHKPIINVFRSPRTYSFLHHLIPGGLCCSAPTQVTVVPTNHPSLSKNQHPFLLSISCAH